MFYGKILLITDCGAHFLIRLQAPKGRTHQFSIPRRGMPLQVRTGQCAIVDPSRQELRLP